MPERESKVPGKSRKLLLFVLFIFLAVSLHLYADGEYSVKQTFFLPPTYYVGDHVELRIRIKTASNLLPAEPDILPEAAWLDIHSIEIVSVSDEYDIRIRFTSYSPGTRALPAIKLGQITLDNIKIFTSSIIEDKNADFADVANPALLPGTRLLLALFIGAILLGPGLAVLFFRWGKKIVLIIRKRLMSRKPFKLFVRSMDMLGESGSAVKSREFYISLVEVLRKYISMRLEMDILTSTTTELSFRLHDRLRESSFIEGLSKKMYDFDKAKFGGRRVTKARRKKDIDAVMQTAIIIEDMFSGEKRDVDA
jgi:hypothetical protein